MLSQLLWRLTVAMLCVSGWTTSHAQSVNSEDFLVDVDVALLRRSDQAIKVQLPFYFHSRSSDFEPDAVWIEFTVPLAVKPESTFGVFSRHINRAALLYVNGRLVGSCAQGGIEKANCSWRPTLIEIAPDYLRAGENLFQVVLAPSHAKKSGISMLTVGNLDALQRSSRVKESFFATTIAQHLVWLVLFVGLLSFIVGLGMSERMYLLFGVALLLESAQQFAIMQSVYPMDPRVFEAGQRLCRLVGVPVFLSALLQLLDLQKRNVNRFLLHYAWISPLTWILIGVRSIHFQWLIAPVLGVMGWVVYEVTIRAIRTSSFSRLLVPLFLILLLYLAYLDWYALNRARTYTWLTPSWFTVLGTVALLGIVTVKRAVASMRHSLHHASILEIRLAERETALAQTYMTLIAAERHNSTMAERERIMADMHDGLGSTLTAARLAIDSGALGTKETAYVVQDCIDDLRLILECSSPSADCFADVFTDYRFRIDRALQAAGITSSWHNGLPTSLRFETAVSLNIMRIIQEAVTNALRHSHASIVEVSACVQNDDAPDPGNGASERLRICVRAGGCAPSPHTALHPKPPGHGLRNMKARARALGADLQVTIEADYSSVVLELPLTASVHS